jgi:hypothetical protein
MEQAISKKEIQKQIKKYEHLDMFTLLASLLAMMTSIIMVSRDEIPTVAVQTMTSILIFYAILNLCSIKEKLYFQNKYNMLYVYNNPHIRTKMKELNSK